MRGYKNLITEKKYEIQVEITAVHFDPEVTLKLVSSVK